MSFNRLAYDKCAYKTQLQQSVDPLSYAIFQNKYEHVNKCRNELGLVGGAAVSHIGGNLIDVENDLRGQTRSASDCPTKKFPANAAAKTPVQHMKSCQMIAYKQHKHSKFPHNN